MSTKRFKLTKAAKILIFVLIVAIIGGGVFAGIKTGFVKTDKIKDIAGKKTEATVVADDDGNVINTSKDDEKTINLSLDEWIG